MSIEQLLIAAVILFFSSLTQAMIGFAFNLLAIPLLIWAGFSLAQAVVLTSIPMFTQLLTNTWKLRESIVWQDVKRPILIRYITLPIGIWLLYYLNNLDTVYIKQLVGVILLLILASQLFVKFEVKEKLDKLWDYITFGLSGIMLGMLGMGGPPIVLWLLAHNWSAKRTRAFITTVFLFAAPIQIAMLYYKFGDKIPEMFIYAIYAIPIVVLAALLGVKIGNQLNKEKLRVIIVFFLFLLAIVSIFSPYIKPLS